jgi:hypothetical protein
MKAIRLHGTAPDNAGNHHHAGTELTVSDEAKAGCITAKRAVALVKIASASEVEAPEKAKA